MVDWALIFLTGVGVGMFASGLVLMYIAHLLEREDENE